MSNQSDMLIIGGGVVGAACAYYLSERGVRVTLIDKGRIGYGCSYGNGGLIVPAHALPLPMPGIFWQACKWALQPDSPLYIRFRLSSALMRWLLSFMAHSTKHHLHKGAGPLIALAKYSLELYEQFVAGEAEAELDFAKPGLLLACATSKGLDGVRHEMEILDRHGVRGRMLDEAALRQLEPAVTGPVVGGAYYDNQATIEPLKVVQAMASRAAQSGAQVLTETEVIDFATRGRTIISVRTTRGRFSADRFILAAGSWTPQLVRQLNINVPIQAGKGYALIVEPFSPRPSMPILLVEKKLGVTPRQDSIRLAGMLELAGMDQSITPRRVDAIVKGARQYVNLPEEPKITEIWRGLRPCTPDGLPMIGPVEGWDNLMIAAGHATLGLTLATGTGRLVADLVTGQHSPVDPAPFAPSRF